jgi:hypothetical protein
MSTRNCVRSRLKDFIASATEFVALVETGGIAFSNGYCFELVKNDVGSLGFLDSKSREFQERINFAGQEFVPPKLAPSVLEAVTLPTKRIDCGSTVQMFSRIYSLFIGYGFSEDVSQASTYFVLASWFPESLPVAPCLILSGTEAEARVVLELLMCLVRHALPLAEINLDVFDCLPMHIQPTMLISRVDSSMWRVLTASNYLHAYLPNKKGLTDLYCAKAAYAGPTLAEVGDNAILNIHCTPNGGRLPVINAAKLEEIAADLQPRLLDYRFKYIAQVRQADFDAPTLPTPLRMMARALGACIVDKPELQVEIVRLLESQAELLRASRMLDPNCVAIEALLTHCHGENGPIRVGVNEVAATATSILTDRGETAAFESKRMGGQLRQLGFCPKRDSQGFAIHLRADVRRLTHRLARDHQVGDSEQTMPGCPDCTEGTSAQAGRSNS